MTLLAAAAMIIGVLMELFAFRARKLEKAPATHNPPRHQGKHTSIISHFGTHTRTFHWLLTYFANSLNTPRLSYEPK